VARSCERAAARSPDGKGLMSRRLPRSPRSIPCHPQILSGATVEHFHAELSDRLVQMVREDAVAIMKKVFIPILKCNCLTQLLQCPRRIGMSGDVAMDQAPAAVLNHDEHVQLAKRCRDGEKEITGNDPLSMQTQEGRPAQVTSRSAPRGRRQILPHRSWGSV
jgi:hypothetical protein